MKSIAIVGALDTRGDEVDYLKNEVEKKGYRAEIVDVGVLGKPMCKASYARETVAEMGGKALSVLISEAEAGADRKAATDVMINGACAILQELEGSGELSGAICLGGSSGAAVGSAVMAALPVGMPKIVLTTFVQLLSAGAEDIVVMQSPVDLVGLNKIVMRTLSQAASAITGMIETELDVQEEKPLIGITALGVTTPAVQKVIALLAKRGFDSIVFHAMTAQLNRLAEGGVIDAVIDLTPYEMIPQTLYSEEQILMMTGGASTELRRLSVLEEKAIPLVISAGGLDLHILPGVTSIDDAPDNFKAREWTMHGPNILLARTSKEELSAVGKSLGEFSNNAAGNVEIIIPLKGFSEVDRLDAPLYDPKADGAFTDAIKVVAQGVAIYEYDLHINDDDFAIALVDALERVKA